MEISEESKEARDIIQNLIKSKKTIRMYPQNNPIYAKILEDSYTRFKSFFDYHESIVLSIKQNSILYDNEQIYYNPDKEDNLALFFFKDGLRELTFKKGLMREELEEFLKIIALDFDRDAIDDDVVTLLWEKDFQNIQYVVDEAFLADADEEDYSIKTEEKAKEKVTDVNDLMKAYEDGFVQEDVKGISIVPLTDNDLQMLVKELEKDSSEKIGKLTLILFEIIYQSEDKTDVEQAFTFLKDAINFSMKHGDMETAIEVMRKAKKILENPLMAENEKRYMMLLPSYLGTDEIISLLADILDSGIEIDTTIYDEFVAHLEKNAIEPLIKYLGELKTIRARKNVIEALISIGKKDIQALSRGLDDQRWYVVRNIIYILRRIGDRRAIDYLLKTVKHSDIRVRKEGIKALGDLGGKEGIQTLRECLDDTDMQIRVAAAKSFASIGSEAPKRILLDKIAEKSFKDKDFEEKKEFFEAISRWKDPEIFDFLVKILKTKSFFGRAKLYESKACALLCLGLLGNKDALPLLYKYQDSGNKLLRDFSLSAIKKLEYGN
ncbi:MAG: HEAT repeat domain-containing protein [Nitrospirota bacterium]